MSSRGARGLKLILYLSFDVGLKLTETSQQKYRSVLFMLHEVNQLTEYQSKAVFIRMGNSV